MHANEVELTLKITNLEVLLPPRHRFLYFLVVKFHMHFLKSIPVSTLFRVNCSTWISLVNVGDNHRWKLQNTVSHGSNYEGGILVVEKIRKCKVRSCAVGVHFLICKFGKGFNLKCLRLHSLSLFPSFGVKD